MRTVGIALIVGICVAAGVRTAAAQCTLDHFQVGQDEGTLMVDLAQVYRHWNQDASVPNTGQTYYEFIYSDVFGFWARTEPGFGEWEDGLHDLLGTAGTDYDLYVERVYATPGLTMYDDNWQPLLQSDGDMFCLSDYVNHHVHMKYLVWDDPTDCYEVRYRLVDATGTYASSEAFSVFFGAVAPEPATLGLMGIGTMVAAGVRRWRRRGERA